MALYYHAFWPALDALSRAKAGRPDTELPPPSRLPVSSEPHAADFRKLARYTFRYDLRGGRLETAGGAPSAAGRRWVRGTRSEEHTSEIQSPFNIVCRLLLLKKKKKNIYPHSSPQYTADH